jgi:hypothetical protein
MNLGIMDAKRKLENIKFEAMKDERLNLKDKNNFMRNLQAKQKMNSILNLQKVELASKIMNEKKTNKMQEIQKLKVKEMIE